MLDGVIKDEDLDAICVCEGGAYSASEHCRESAPMDMAGIHEAVEGVLWEGHGAVFTVHLYEEERWGKTVEKAMRKILRAWWLNYIKRIREAPFFKPYNSFRKCAFALHKHYLARLPKKGSFKRCMIDRVFHTKRLLGIPSHGFYFMLPCHLVKNQFTKCSRYVMLTLRRFFNIRDNLLKGRRV